MHLHLNNTVNQGFNLRALKDIQHKNVKEMNSDAMFQVHLKNQWELIRQSLGFFAF